MTYASTLQVARATGVGVEVTGENVGTGDSSATSFDLDYNNVIAGSYSLYCADSGSNDFTNLTDSTHYVLNKDRGTIELTAAGVTALGTKVLYADYVHSPNMSDTKMATFLAPADEEVEKATGAYWGTPRSQTEYFDGRNSQLYPTTDYPHGLDYNAPDSVKLSKRNITSVNAAYFLKRGTGLSLVYSYDGDEATYTDNTSEANSAGGTGFNAFATTTASGDILYVGSAYMFLGLTINLFTAGATSNNPVWEYYNGSSWATLTVTADVTGTDYLTASGKITWSEPSSWTKVAVNSSESLYWIRLRATGAYTTEPVVKHLSMNQDSVIDTNIPLYDIDYTSTGKVSFLSNRIPSGTRNVRIDFDEGQTTTDDIIGELASLYAGLRVYAAITGGSYDAATSFTLGRKAVTIGEQYVNVREVVRQFQERIDEILRTVVGNQFAIGVV